MKLERLRARSLLGISEIDLTFSRPVSLFVGPNNAGKSSVRDCIAFAMSGKARGVKTFKAAGDLQSRSVSGDMKVQLDIQENADSRRITRTKSTISDGASVDPAMFYCLHPEEFIALPAKDRCGLLSQVLGGGRDEIAKAAIKKRIGTLHVSVKSYLKERNISLLNLDAFQATVIELRRQSKRELKELPVKPPLLGDFELHQGYDADQDRAAVNAMAVELKDAAELLASAREQIYFKADLLELDKEITHLKEQKVNVRPLPAGVTVEEAEWAISVMKMLEHSLQRTNAKTVTCVACKGSRTREKMEAEYSNATNDADRLGKAVGLYLKATTSNEGLEVKIRDATAKIKAINKKTSRVDLPENSDTLVVDLTTKRDLKLANLGAFQRFTDAVERYNSADEGRDTLKDCIEDCDRVDAALKPGGPVRSYISEHGRKLPINKKLLDLWDMQDLEITNTGEIFLHMVPIELASSSERSRAAWTIGLALAELSGVGVAAVDGFDILLAANQNAFMKAIAETKINNVLVFCSSDKKFTSAQCKEWIEIYTVDNGKVTRV